MWWAHLTCLYDPSQCKLFEFNLVLLLIVLSEVSVKYQYILISIACNKDIALPVYISENIPTLLSQCLDRHNKLLLGILSLLIEFKHLTRLVFLADYDIFEVLGALDNFNEGVRTDWPNSYRLIKFFVHQVIWIKRTKWLVWVNFLVVAF